jgi:integral membrane sensor domain MASE1
VATIIGSACLNADHNPVEYKTAAFMWFLGDVISLVGIAPFLLIHVLPGVRDWLSATPFDLHSTRAYSRRTTLTFGGLVEACSRGLTTAAILCVMFGIKEGRYDHFYLCSFRSSGLRCLKESGKLSPVCWL